VEPAEAQTAEAFCARVRPWLIGSLSLYCGDADVAEELAQETLARVWDRWPKVAAMQAPESWAYRVALNLANSHYRRRAAERRATARQDRPVTSFEDPDTAAALTIRHAVSRLPRRQRAALVLRYYSDLSVVETAALLGCAPGTVKALTHQAIAGLRNSADGLELLGATNGL
jgi:RNA polymerase sigma-70 factor (sigma-E family)